MANIINSKGNVGWEGATKKVAGQLCEYMEKWVEEHKDGSVDTWTNSDRHAITDSGVTS